MFRLVYMYFEVNIEIIGRPYFPSRIVPIILITTNCFAALKND